MTFNDSLGPSCGGTLQRQPPRRAGRALSGLWCVAVAAALCPPGAYCQDAPPVSDAIVRGLMTQNLVGDPGKEIVMITVTYLPGGASLPHRHDAQVFVYVLEGALSMQVRGAAARTLRRGQTFYEGPDDIHQVSANASRTRPAKMLVFIVKDKAKPASRAVTD